MPRQGRPNCDSSRSLPDAASTIESLNGTFEDTDLRRADRLCEPINAGAGQRYHRVSHLNHFRRCSSSTAVTAPTPSIFRPHDAHVGDPVLRRIGSARGRHPLRGGAQRGNLSRRANHPHGRRYPHLGRTGARRDSGGQVEVPPRPGLRCGADGSLPPL